MANYRQVHTKIPDGEPCSHPGCLSHVTHPCEGCGRIGGRHHLNQELQAAIMEYLDEYEAGKRKLLAEFIEKYPRLQSDLVRFAVYHHTVTHTRLTEEEEQELWDLTSTKDRV